MAVFLLIGKTSALTMNIAGVVKDWMLIGLSVLMYASPVDAIELGGLLHCILGCVHVQLSQAAVHEERTTPSLQGRHAVF